MKEKIIKYSIFAFGYLAVLYPLWVKYNNSIWLNDSNTILFNLFTGFGLIAFSILWLHAVSGAFEPWLKQYFNFERYVQITSTIVLFCIILHPILLLISIDFNIIDLLTSGEGLYVILGITGWLLLITYDIGKFLKRKYDFFVKNWTNILIISNVGFIFTFFHSLFIGGDLESGPLRKVWIFYGITAIISLIYTYGIKRLYHQK